MKTCVILGTRPEIIKLSPVIQALEKDNLEYDILHTGQHYSERLDKIFFKELGLRDPDMNLKTGSGSHATETARMLLGIEKALIRLKPDTVLVEGDTNTVLSGALAAAKLNTPIVHVEAGLRSYDMNMPEEINRVLTDHMSTIHFPPTREAEENLFSEGIFGENVHVTGNTIVDALTQNKKNIDNSAIIEELNLTKNDYFVLTIHRQENVDNLKRIRAILEGVMAVKKQYGKRVVFPIHPRTNKMLNSSKLNSNALDLIEPLGFFDFVRLVKDSKLVYTDSGGVQEEACIVSTPCVTLRDNTERPETINVGSNILCQANAEDLLKKTSKMIGNSSWSQPFGDGKAGEKIIKLTSDYFKE